MKIQYIGDISDYRKYVLLRAFAQKGLKIGVCWIMTEPDGRSDGRFRSYLKQPDKWRAYDPELFDTMNAVPAAPTSTDLESLEASNFIPGTVFFNDAAPNALVDRNLWHGKTIEKFAASDLVFFDPDNGFEVSSRRKGRAGSNKFVFFDEVTDHYQSGRSVLVYQHFPRKARSQFIHGLAEQLAEKMQGASIWAFETAHVVFMLASRPEHHLIANNVETSFHQRFIPRLFQKATLVKVEHA